MIIGVVDSVTRIEQLSDDFDYCSIQIDLDSLKIFGRYSELTEFIGKKVSYDVRKDCYKGQIIIVVTNIADIYKVMSLDKVKDIRLVTEDNMERPSCNFVTDSLRFGETQVNCSAFLSSYSIGSSLKAKWIDCRMLDAKSKAFELRVFVDDLVVEEQEISKYVGHYVLFDVTSTKYGLQASKISFIDVPTLCPPEVETATAIILQSLEKDEELREYVEHFSFIETLRNIIDLEPGYHLVRVASEICLINSLENITNLYDTRLLVRAAITSRGYLLPAKTKFSRPLLNTTKVLKTKLMSDRELLLILDPVADEKASPTKRAYMEIARFVNKIVNERRGIDDKEVMEDLDIVSLRHRTGGLL